MSLVESSSALLVLTLTMLAVVLMAARNVYIAGCRNKIIEVFEHHTATPLTAETLGEEAQMNSKLTYKALNQLNRSNQLRRIGIGSVPHYLYVEHPQPLAGPVSTENAHTRCVYMAIRQTDGMTDRQIFEEFKDCPATRRSLKRLCRLGHITAERQAGVPSTCYSPCTYRPVEE